MERRYVVFMILVALILGGQIALRAYLAPKRPAVNNEQAEAPPDDAEKAKAEQDKTAGEKAAKKPAAEKVAGQPPQDEKPLPPEAAVAPPLRKAPRQQITLGSLDPNSGYTMLVTLDSRGAALARVELSNPKYRELDFTVGYLGQLALEDAADGCLVQVVGDGAPAALAIEMSGQVSGGLQPGDVIQSIGGMATPDTRALENFLAKKGKPGETVELAVSRKPTKEKGKEEESLHLKFSTKLTRAPLQIIQPETHGDAEHPDPLSLLLTLDNVMGKTIKMSEGGREIRGLPSLRESNWELTKQTPGMAEFTFTLDQADVQGIPQASPLKIVKRFILAKLEQPGEAGYHLDFQIELHNLGAKPQQLGYRLEGPNGLPTEGWWYSNKLHPELHFMSTRGIAGARDITWKRSQGHHRLLGCSLLVGDAKTAQTAGKPLDQQLEELPGAFDYVGVDTQFFSAALLPQSTPENPLEFRSFTAQPVQDVSLIPKGRQKTANVSFTLSTVPLKVEKGESVTHSYRLFLGPKEPAVLNQYGLDALIEYGWNVFKLPAYYLSKLLHALYFITGNYGLSIVLLTVIVRSLMVPLSLKQAKSAAKMQELAPEMAKIKEKHKDDMQKQSEAMKQLYAKHNFNPFGGCFLMFFQLPVFIGLYRCLSVDIALRDADLIPGALWCSNLAGPDRLFDWKALLPAMFADETGWLGPFCNVLPVITCLLFIVQQKLFTPPPTDEQSEMQQKMMMYMTVFMGVMFFKVPSGLCIYFIVSSVWSIVERKLLPKPTPAVAGGLAKDSSVSGKRK